MKMLTTLNITTLNPKLWIVDYYSDLINKIDISTEKIIYRCRISSKIKDKLNSIRVRFIDEIKRVESCNLENYENNIEWYSSKLKNLNLKKLNQSHDLILELKRELFKNYCFFIDARDLPRNTSYLLGVLITTDWYVADKEVDILIESSKEFYSVSSDEKNITIDEGLFRLSCIRNELFRLKRKIIKKKVLKFNNIESVEELRLGSLYANTIGECSFNKFKQLKVLNLSLNNVDVLNNYIFQDLVNLQELDLSNNMIKRICGNTFSGLNQLKKLNLKANFISYINPYAFNNLTNLIELNLRNNEIEKLKPGIFFDLVNLKVLDLTENKLSTLKYDTFSGLYNLDELIIQNNSLEEIHAGAFESLTSLKKLDLRGNIMVSLQQSMFNGLSNLKELDLRSNFINSVENSPFAELKSLEKLDLVHNEIKRITKISFDCLTNLVKLDLCYNYIENIDSNSFKNLINLNEIDLRLNKLTKRKQGTYLFDGLSNLRFYYF